MEWKKVLEQILQTKSELETISWDTHRTLSSSFFKIREIIEKYFSSSKYIKDIDNVIYEVDNDQSFWREYEKLLGILEGLIKRVEFNIESGAENIPSSNEVEKELERLKERSELLANEIENERTKSKKLTEDLENERILQNNRYKELSKIELLKQEEIFVKVADTNRKYSWFWLIAIGITIIILVSLLGKFINDFCVDLACFNSQKQMCESCNVDSLLIFELTRSSIYRITVISIVIYFLVFLIKNYNAVMHNYTVNMQKANSFAASFVMINGATTVEGRDNIMSQAAQSIFSHQNTGYVGRDNEPSNPLFIEKVISK